MGTLNVNRLCFCGGVQAPIEVCARNPCVTLNETRSCPLNCSCAWVNVTDWSNCSSSCGPGIQYLIRSCNCTSNSTTTSTTPITKGDTKDKDKDDKDSKPTKTKKSKGKRYLSNGDGGDAPKPKDGKDSKSKLTIPTGVYDPACQGYTVITRSCSTPCPVKGDTDDKKKKDKRR